jgi:HAD superfamily hydrolase (TIGR01509 family)
VLAHRHWIFDLDGTLTLAAHDFGAIRRMLELPADKGILEAIAELPPSRAAVVMQRLDEHEHQLACSAAPAPGASALLAALHARGTRLGIVTRNSLRNLETTLHAAGLAKHFARAGFVTRERGAPKPRPDGILHLLSLWKAVPGDAVMVGNHRIDVQAGHAAGTATVHVDAAGACTDAECADIEVRGLDELLAMIDA